MPFQQAGLEAIIFDYGNTLVQLDTEKVRAYDETLAHALTQRFGREPDIGQLIAIRDENRMAPYTGDPPQYRENDLPAITRDLIQRLFDIEPTPEDIAHIIRIRHDAFVAMVTLPDYVPPFLERLADRYRLGLLSNYPDGGTVRASIDALGLTPFFQSMVISADVGLVKPHPLPFERILAQLQVQPHQALYVGDNWLADVQGAKRAGMFAALLCQWQIPEPIKRKPEDTDPDLVLYHLLELENYI